MDLLASFFNNQCWIQRYKLNFDPNVTWLYRGPTALNKMHRENFLYANLDHRQASGGLAVRTLHTSLIHATISRCSLINSQQNFPAHVPASRTSWLTVVLQSFIETPTNVAAELLYQSRGSNTTRHVSCSM